MLTARISRGRTAREFVLAAMRVYIVGFVWFAVVGAAGIHAALNAFAPQLSERAAENQALSL